MNVRIITPAPPRSRTGNRVTALRWARVLGRLGHRVKLAGAYRDEPCHLMIALHARRSHAAIARYRERRPQGPLIVALTGTDLYGDIHNDANARRSLEMAQRLVALQPKALEELTPTLRQKTHIILQSVPPRASRSAPNKTTFDVAVVGHLRQVKDPLLAAAAARLLPEDS